MKKIICISIALILALLSAGICFADDRTEIYDEDALLESLKNGENMILHANLSLDYEGSLIYTKNCVIDLNGHRLTICADDYSIMGQLTFMNGDVNLMGEDRGDGVMSLENSLSMKNGNINLTRLYIKVKPEGCILLADDNSHVMLSPSMSTTPYTSLNIDPQDLSEEAYTEMVKSGTLPALSREGYTFDGWEDRSGKKLTTWKSDVRLQLTPVFVQSPTASIFGGGSLWMVLSCVFFLSTAVLAVVNAKLRKRLNTEK